MRSVRPKGAAGSRLRAFIEEFPSPAGGTNRYTQSEDRRATVGCASYLRFCDLCGHVDVGRLGWDGRYLFAGYGARASDAQVIERIRGVGTPWAQNGHSYR